MSGKARPWTIDTVRSRCDIEPIPGGCWLWTQGLNNRNGKPQACIGGRCQLVDRWLLRHLGRPAPKQRPVTTTCGNRLCLNPAHLVEKSHSDVLRDAYATGKRSAAREYVGRLQAAQKSGRAKLTPEVAAQVRQRAAAGECRHAIAADLSISEGAVGRIVRGQAWRALAPTASVFALGAGL